MWPFKKRENNPEQFLRPGLCECEHDRSAHVGGKGRCKGSFAPDEETDYWTGCSCQIYIRDDEGGDDPIPETPTPAELEKLYGR